MSRCIIVGHAPSMLLEEMGELIDGYDTVIRLKNCRQTLMKPEFYGTKTDIVGGSLTIAGQLRDLTSEKFWIWTDSRHEGWEWNDQINALPHIFTNKRVFIDRDLCNTWNTTYRNMREATPDHNWDEAMRASRYDTGEGENHMSQGLHALVYACALLKPDAVDLIGFDNVLTGEFNWSVTRGEDWDKYPRHRWDIENKMVDIISKHYDVPVVCPLPLHRPAANAVGNRRPRVCRQFC